MNTGYGFGKRSARDAQRSSDTIRFLGTALALWAACAAGIYLIGPGDSGDAAPDAEIIAVAAPQVNASAAEYEP
jgi:hypothetical protein